MAYCVISAVADPVKLSAQPGCVVHAEWAPCHRNGEPASTVVLHTDDVNGRDRVVSLWARRTHRQRPLVIHHGDLGSQEAGSTPRKATTGCAGATRK
jgi:hypothetical protein